MVRLVSSTQPPAPSATSQPGPRLVGQSASSSWLRLPSPAPLTAAWSKAPLCPLWGPMDSFYEEGIERGRVSWLAFGLKYYFSELFERNRC